MSDSTLRLLIVDDHPVVRDGLQGMLAGEPDFEVVGEAADGAEAVTRAELLQPDVILMDLNMPGIDGFETTRLIMETHPVPIVICTATTNSKEVAFTFRSMEAGAVACGQAQGHERGLVPRPRDLER